MIVDVIHADVLDCGNEFDVGAVDV